MTIKLYTDQAYYKKYITFISAPNSDKYWHGAY